MTIQLMTKGMVSKNSRGYFQGEILINANKWQLISIPVKYGYYDTITNSIQASQSVRAKIYNYVIIQLADTYNDNIENLVEVINTYTGNNDFFYNYIPGFTPENSIHNFPLTIVDNTKTEIVPFWIKSIANFDMILKWKS